MASCDPLAKSEWLRHPDQVRNGNGLLGVGVNQDLMFSVNLKDAYSRYLFIQTLDLISRLCSKEESTSSRLYALVFLQLPRSSPECVLWFWSRLIREGFNFNIIWTAGW